MKNYLAIALLVSFVAMNAGEPKKKIFEGYKESFDKLKKRFKHHPFAALGGDVLQLVWHC